MALPRCERMLSVALFAVWCLSLSISTSVAEHLVSSSSSGYISSSSTGAWELPIIAEQSCDPSTPVCGEGGIEFESACHAIAAGVPIVETEACRNRINQQEQDQDQDQDQEPEQEQEQGQGRQQQQQQQREVATCNVKCFRADPVCGQNAVTYWCGAAEAQCAGVEVAHKSFCDPRNGASGKKGTRATQSLFLVNLVWLAVAGFLVIAGFL